MKVILINILSCPELKRVQKLTNELAYYKHFQFSNTVYAKGIKLNGDLRYLRDSTSKQLRSLVDTSTDQKSTIRTTTYGYPVVEQTRGLEVI